jgi:hypothetical protein
MQELTALNTSTHLPVVVKSNRAGEYTSNSLPVGEYKVSTVSTGFAPLIETGVPLNVGQSATLNLPLTLGGE